MLQTNFANKWESVILLLNLYPLLLDTEKDLNGSAKDLEQIKKSVESLSYDLQGELRALLQQEAAKFVAQHASHCIAEAEMRARLNMKKNKKYNAKQQKEQEREMLESEFFRRLMGSLSHEMKSVCH